FRSERDAGGAPAPDGSLRARAPIQLQPRDTPLPAPREPLRAVDRSATRPAPRVRLARSTLDFPRPAQTEAPRARTPVPRRHARAHSCDRASTLPRKYRPPLADFPRNTSRTVLDLVDSARKRQRSPCIAETVDHVRPRSSGS